MLTQTMTIKQTDNLVVAADVINWIIQCTFSDPLPATLTEVQKAKDMLFWFLFQEGGHMNSLADEMQKEVWGGF